MMHDGPLDSPAKPKVTVAIPTLNRVGYLRLALESTLRQTYSNLEIVISNNCSTDETAEYLRSLNDPRLIILTQTVFLSMVENWNACLASATGEYFILLSDDDLLEPTAIEKLVAAYQLASEVDPPGFIYCGAKVIDSEGAVYSQTVPSPDKESSQELILGFFASKRSVLLCTILYRTRDLGTGFPSGFTVANDAAMWMAIAVRYGYVIHIEDELTRYRQHLKNLSNKTSPSIWKKENEALAVVVLETQRSIGKSDLEFAAKLAVASQRQAIRSLVHFINQSLGARKTVALREYGRQLPAFLSPYGIRVLAKGLLSLFVSEKIKSKLR